MKAVAKTLIGAHQIADYLGINRGRVYTLVSNKRLPIFRIYNTICARVDTLDAWIKRQEEEAIKPKAGDQARGGDR